MSHTTSCTKVKNIDEVNLAERGVDLEALRQTRDVFLLGQYTLASRSASLDIGDGRFEFGGEHWEVSAVPSLELVLLKRGATYMLVHADTVLPTYAQATFAVDAQTYDATLVRPIVEQQIEAIQLLLPWVKAMESELQA